MKAYKIEINPTKFQIEKINKTIGTCRFIYNFYLSHNIENYKLNKTFISAFDFSKWLNNEFLPNNQDKLWIKDVSSKAVKQSIINGEKAFKNFFKYKKGFPKFKKKNKQDIKCYFPKNNKTDWIIQRHRVKIPTLGFVRLKEFGYIPINSNVKSGTISKSADRYYVSILVDEEPIKINKNNYSNGIGIDVGIKDTIICSNGIKFKNINKTSKVKKLEKRLKRKQKQLSRKYESYKKNNKKEGGTVTRQNIQKNIVEIQNLHNRLTNIRNDYNNKIVNTLVKIKPRYITIEDLNISGMLKNKHLSKAIQQQKLYSLINKLIIKSKNNNIEIRQVNRFYPSSKLCNCCGNIKKDLKLSDRIYYCEECKVKIDRDLNAAYNLRDAKEYKII